ncbi:hypothetical protein AB0O65_02215 [Microbacterium sp. NPDC077391]|uniref:phenylacetate--CoA ligase family protein n=1 Tax=Microbacterium sp. NPDC077391 TaxID=3154765 RepID=UPI003419BC28
MRKAIFDAKTSVLMRRDRRALREMLRHERLTREQAQLVSDERSARIALHAYRTTPFYRRHFSDAGFTEADVSRPENFALLPALSKAAVQDAGDALVSSDSASRDLLVSRTGGSTGRPLQVFNDRRAPVAALWWRVYSWWGIHPSDHAAFIYRQSRVGAKKLRYDMEWWPTRHLLLDARGATPESIADFEREVARLRPRLLVGYVEGVVDFARFVARQGMSVPGLAAISVTASMLHPGQREEVESVLRAPVFDTYRSAEVPWIAAECAAHSGLHVLSDRRRVDIVDGTAAVLEPGAVGDVLVTDFDNRAYPLIRYAIGDRSRIIGGECACGRSLARIDHIQGRIADVLRTPSGRSVSGGLGGLFNAWPGVVRQFQIHQTEDYSVTIRYVSGPDHQAAARAAESVCRTVSGFLAREVEVRAQRVDAVQNQGGKARMVISDVPAAVG